MVSAIDEEMNQGMDDTSGMLETPYCVLGDEEIGWNMEDEPLIPDMAIGWWNEGKG